MDYGTCAGQHARGRMSRTCRLEHRAAHVALAQGKHLRMPSESTSSRLQSGVDEREAEDVHHLGIRPILESNERGKKSKHLCQASRAEGWRRVFVQLRARASKRRGGIIHRPAFHAPERCPDDVEERLPRKSLQQL